MIDTVVLTISKDKMQSLDNTLGRYPIWSPQSKSGHYAKWIKNMPKQKDETDPYYPRLTAWRRFGKEESDIPMVNIEFSVPKLIYQNNLDEVEESNLKLVVQTLVKRLREMGEVVEENLIENAVVSAFHPSKNIELSEDYYG